MIIKTTKKIVQYRVNILANILASHIPMLSPQRVWERGYIRARSTERSLCPLQLLMYVPLGAVSKSTVCLFEK